MDILSLPEANRVRVVVIPVGAITPKRFQHFFQMISSFHTLPLSEMPRNITDKNRVLKQDWANGVFCFHFTEFKDWHKSEWEELHCTRKALAVVGVIDGTVTSLGDAGAAYKIMVDSLKRFPSLLSHICFTFEPDGPDLQERNPHFIVLPPTPEKDNEKVLFYLNTWVPDFAARLLRLMEDWVFDATEAQATLTTSFDSNQSGSDDMQKLKKRKASRLLKSKGDYCMLVGAPNDALTYYEEAHQQTKATSDLLWFAATLESQAAATLLAALQEEEGQNVTSLKSEVIEEITEVMTEAIQSYTRRKATGLEVEAWLKLGKLYASLGRRSEANESWMSAHHCAYALTKQVTHALQLRIQLSLELTAVYTELGMRRKAAFFLRDAALLHAKIFNHALSHRLLSIACPAYLLHSDAAPVQAVVSAAQRERAARVKRDGVPLGWGVLQKYLLKDLIDSSKSSNDPNTTAGYITYLLRNYRDLLSSKYQVKLANALSAVTDDLPVSLLSVTPDPLPPSLSAYPKLAEVAEKSIFITSPFARKKEKKLEMTWVENEVAEVQVILANPMAFPITVESMTLSTTGVPFEAYSMSLVIPAHTPKVSVLLSGKPLASGVLFVKGCTIRTFNLLCEHPIGSSGKSISLTEAAKTKFDPALVAGQVNAVRIVPSLPRLLVRDQSTAAGNISLYIGQDYCFAIRTASAEFEVENIGGQPITYMELSVQANYQQSLRDSPQCTFVWDDEKIKSALPLAPGAKFAFSTSFTARPLTVGHTLTIAYGNESHADWSRRVEVSCPVNLLQGLGVGRIDTIEWAGTAIPFADIPTVASPCVLLSFEVVNSGPTVFSLECQVSDDSGPFYNSNASTIAPHSSTRVLLPLKKFVLPPEAAPIQPVHKNHRRVPEVDRYLAELSRRVCMRWKSLTSNSDGVLTFLTANVFFPESCVGLLSAPPVNVHLRLKGKAEITAATSRLHEFQEIEVLVYNCSSKARTMTVSLLGYQDFNNGIIESNLRGKVAISGATQACVPNVGPGASLTHLVVVAFLAAGRYKFSATCRDEDGALYGTPVPLCILAALGPSV